jgi:L-2,4-diaminobutyric acid acetyltransferase
MSQEQALDRAVQPSAGTDASLRPAITLRNPTARDGKNVWSLVRDCAPLDENSMYCNLLQCSHFANTCVLAERGDDIVGWVSAYRPPEEPDVIFIWQVAVSEKARGEGLGKKLLQHLLGLDAAAGVHYLKTTITKDNAASWRLFSSLAKSAPAPMRDAPWFEKDRDFGGAHETEHMVTIGPF